MLAALCSAIEERDPYTRGHCLRVADLAVSLGTLLGWNGRRLGVLRLGGLLHDIGKLAVSHRILGKPGPLDEHELAAVRTHPVTGAKLLEPFRVARPALACVLFHHERWDGGGYPTGRAATTIPEEARVLALADAFDAMTTARPYRPAFDTDVALAEIRRCAGTQFDPRLAHAFVRLWDDGAIAAAS